MNVVRLAGSGLVFSLLAACGSDASLTCGPGTVRDGSRCVVKSASGGSAGSHAAGGRAGSSSGDGTAGDGESGAGGERMPANRGGTGGGAGRTAAGGRSATGGRSAAGGTKGSSAGSGGTAPVDNGGQAAEAGNGGTPGSEHAPSSPVPVVQRIGRDGVEAGPLVCAFDLQGLAADGDELAASVSWRRNGEPVAAGSLSSTVHPNDTVPEALLAPGDTWDCSVTASNGSDESAPGVSAPFTLPELTLVELKAAVASTCALWSDGHVECWGSNTARQSSTALAEPFVHVFPGSTTHCGLRANQELACWGTTNFGLLNSPSGPIALAGLTNTYAAALRSDGSIVDWGSMSGKVSLPAGAFVDIDAGDSFSIVRAADGHATAWGAFVDDSIRPPAEAFDQVTGGGSHACGIRSADKKVECWGSDVFGETEAPDHTFAEVAAGTWATCARDAAGLVQCWGDDDFYAVSNAPTEALASLNAKTYHFCGLTTAGQPACWGRNTRLETQIPWQLQASSVAFSAGSGCVLQTDGKLVCVWPRTPSLAVPSGTFVAAGGADTFACAADAAGALTCFGSTVPAPPSEPHHALSVGEHGACALANSDSSVSCWGTIGTVAPTSPPPGAFTQVSVGSDHACGLDTSGNVACWGDSSAATSAPPGTFTFVSTGEIATCGIHSDASLECWGDSATAAPPLGTFKAVSVGHRNACGIRSDGSLTCWGTDTDGDNAPPPGGTYVSVDMNFYQGNGGGCAVTTAGRLRCWGAMWF